MQDFCVLFTFAESGIAKKIKLVHEKSKNKCNPRVFLDSGAFTAATTGREINIDDYIQFVYDHYDRLSVYANLDVIFDPINTRENQRIMKEAGLNPLPVFHQGSHFNYLKEIAEQYDYICLGGPGRGGIETHAQWSKICFSTVYKINPNALVHGFGLTTVEAMEALPYHSVDSTSWICRRYGDMRIYHPIHDRVYFFHRVRPDNIANNYKLLRETLSYYGLTPNDFIKRKNMQRYMCASLKSYQRYAESYRKKKGTGFQIFFASVEQSMLLKDSFFDYVFGPYRLAWGENEKEKI